MRPGTFEPRQKLITLTCRSPRFNENAVSYLVMVEEKKKVFLWSCDLFECLL